MAGVFFGQCREICGSNHRFIPISFETFIFNLCSPLKVENQKLSILIFCLFLQVVAVIIRVAFYTILERKLLGYFQNRKGPNKPGFAGLLVPFGDAVKLGTKENNHPR